MSDIVFSYIGKKHGKYNFRAVKNRHISLYESPIMKKNLTRQFPSFIPISDKTAGIDAEDFFYLKLFWKNRVDERFKD